MNPVARALWFIEHRSASDLTLEDIATGVGVSRFHLSRAFAAATGYPIMRYLRGRRLSVAAGRLASGTDDILSVAIAAGYGSHEAFTRAFRDQFGITPETIRKRRHVENVALIEGIAMNEKSPTQLTPPRFENGKLLYLAGLAERYACETSGAGIPGQWQKLGPYLGHLEGQVGTAAYGVTYNTDEEGNMDYLCGVEVADFARLPAGFARLRVAAQKYAVFVHRGHVSGIRGTWAAIWNDWLPQSGHEAADAPVFERYDERFDPRTGNGEVEIWIALAH